jgi:hypothetical protein
MHSKASIIQIHFFVYCTCAQADSSPFKLYDLLLFVFFCSIVACNGDATQVIVVDYFSSHFFVVA